ncbi:hypothetical protein, partial [Aquimonas sp.]|uniref:hypothetical protein n=1 Tax=Aquimonas sp. TaxID=1872588 RepID=UPI0037BF1737
MFEQSPDKQKQLAVKIAASVNAAEREAIRIWIEHLLALKATNLPSTQKARQAISITADSKVVVPAVKIIARETKRLAWDERGLKARLGLGGAAVGVALFGGQGAGIAALGTAIGVPLWVVFGAGAAFAGVPYAPTLHETVTQHVISHSRAALFGDSHAKAVAGSPARNIFRR